MKRRTHTYFAKLCHLVSEFLFVTSKTIHGKLSAFRLQNKMRTVIRFQKGFHGHNVKTGGSLCSVTQKRQSFLIFHSKSIDHD